LPFNRMRRRKNDNPGSAWGFSFLNSSRDGGFGDEGIRLTRPSMKPMALKGLSCLFATCLGRGLQ
jgi:hypothetical protein